MIKKKKLMAKLAGLAGLATITATSVIGPMNVGAQTETEPATSILQDLEGMTLNVTSGEKSSYIIKDETKNIAKNTLEGVEGDVYSFYWDKELEETATVDNALTDEEKEKLSVAMDILNESEEEVTYEDTQAAIWTVTSGETVYPLGTKNSDKLEQIQKTLSDGKTETKVSFVFNSATSGENKIIAYSKEKVPEETTEETSGPQTESSEETVSEEDSEEDTKEDSVSDEVILETKEEDSIPRNLQEVKEELQENNEKSDYTLSVEYLLTDSDTFNKTKNVDAFWELVNSSVEKENSIKLTQLSEDVPLYDSGDGYYEGFLVSPSKKDAIKELGEYDAAYDNTLGQVINGVLFDYENNKIKVPKKYFEGTDNNEYDESHPLKVQFLTNYDYANSVSTIDVNIINERKDVETENVVQIKANDFASDIEIPLIKNDAEVSVDDIKVTINKNYVLDAEMMSIKDGKLSIAGMAFDIAEIDVQIFDIDDIFDLEDIVTYTAYADNVSVKVEAEKDTFKENVKLEIKEIDAKKYIDEYNKTHNNSADEAYALDISFINNEGEEIEPSKPVKVDMKYNGDVFDAQDDIKIYHDNKGELEYVSDNAQKNGSELRTNFYADAFSAYVAINPTGSNILSLGKLKNVNMDMIRWMANNKVTRWANTGAGYAEGWGDDIIVNQSRLYGGTSIGSEPQASQFYRAIREQEKLSGGHYYRYDDFEGFARTNQVAHESPILLFAVNLQNIMMSTLGDESNHRIVGTGDFDTQPMVTKSWGESWSPYGNYTHMVPLICMHASAAGYDSPMFKETSAAGTQGWHDDAYNSIQILYLQEDGDNPYMVVGLACQGVGVRTQEGVGVYRIDLDIEPDDGYVQVQKKIIQDDATRNNTCYTLSGVEFGVYSDANCNNKVATLVTGEDGNTPVSEKLPANRDYWIREDKTNWTLQNSNVNQPKKVTVEPNKTGVAYFEDKGKEDPISIQIKKKIVPRDKKSQEVPAPSLAGAQYKVTGYKSWDYTGEVYKTFTITTNANGTAVISEELPLGSYTIEEIKAPEGYQKDWGDNGDGIIGKFKVGYAHENVNGNENVRIEWDEDCSAFMKTEEYTHEANPSDSVIPTVQTKAIDKNTGNQSTLAKQTTIKDTVTYTNCLVGRTYHLKGVVLDKSTGKPYKDPNGKEVTAEMDFTPQGEAGTAVSGTVVMEIPFNASAQQGKTFVIGETLYDEKRVELTVHHDVNDEDQTVYVPKIGTSAVDDTTKIGEAVIGKTAFTDTVSYENLEPGKTYVLKGVIMDKDKNESTGVTATKTFKATERDGSVSLDFISTYTFDVYVENVDSTAGQLTTVAVLFIIFFALRGCGSGQKIVVKVDGEVYRECDLSRDEVFVVEGYQGGYNTVEIKDGKVSVTDAGCPDKVCVKTGKVSEPGQTIVCLPHRVVVEIP